MQPLDLSLLDMLSLIYEDLDLDNVEERFVDLVAEVFSFDRIALFFVKHKKAVLQGKLAKRFDLAVIQAIEIPLDSESILVKPLASGFPELYDTVLDDQTAQLLGLKHFVLVPLVNRKRLSCWRARKCKVIDCPAYGKNLVRCWTISGTCCANGKPVSDVKKAEQCQRCPVFTNQSIESAEGVLLVDNSVNGRPITNESIAALSIIAHAVGVAVNNSKVYLKTLNDSIKDELTGLHNRRYFNERLFDELDRAKRYGDCNLSLVFCDIDHFKRINDTYGHPVGDLLLVWFSKHLRIGCRKSDIVARYGGEEFAFLLINADKDMAIEIAEKMRRDIEKAIFVHEEIRIQITASFGVATFGIDAGSFEGLLSKADQYLYAAKLNGRNQVQAAS